jgi:hypothetical protein
MTITTLEEAAAQIDQLYKLLRLNRDEKGVFVPQVPEPQLPHAAVAVQSFIMRGRAGKDAMHSTPVPVGMVTWTGTPRASHVKAGMGTPPIVAGVDGKPAVVIVQDATLKLHEVVSPEQLAALVAAAKE